ncbi:polyprenyl synthetase family protein [Campylobacter insulaenigrae]|uniref:Octaprenyl-diphosphate synthase n=2 Tax=Campylobacter insulaenigrae TaxID=260714 RepID=A0A0A8H481_9BACT|nr:polyprenyl synthetase family protein [Campylobacter insulaenigrae]AJC87714.1 octaprenyl-diphosphate synthase [Campylobacter insulaenigrae NCTC 12927]MCR6570089.1 polyprenyl synthetase family protein [Campylobacter insulaenigrae]MCR6571874.1 polyprenyl synthetase family protein [Campylobacter insulaenigrae]MCR6573132.1 polyprenyl synthetase family protein [Campylobacter insulaenigrae]MCR6574919.1 polyprenyl synthetase family protein [Campylobacter insulaenigrae]
MQEIDFYMHKFLSELSYEPIITMSQELKSGKKLRSKLLLKIAGKSQISYKICAIIELIHSASLLHDDVIDEANLRRGVKSINARFGAKNAIMLGDILYSKAFYELSTIDTNLAKIISDAVVKLSIGELMDVNLSQNFNIDKNKYLQMIYNKTAVLIEASARCGAILANLDEYDFAQYGKNLGLAFQIVDDMLDIQSDEKILGKPTMSDFKEGKTTLAYIYLYEKLNQNEKEILQSFFKKNLHQDEILWIKNKMQEYAVLDLVNLELKKYAHNALQSIEKYKIKDLEEIITNMIEREF